MYFQSRQTRSNNQPSHLGKSRRRQRAFNEATLLQYIRDNYIRLSTIEQFQRKLLTTIHRASIRVVFNNS